MGGKKYGGPHDLTEAELDVIRELMNGKNLRDIARERGTSPRTLDAQALSARKKTHCRTNAQMTAMAEREGWLRPEPEPVLVEVQAVEVPADTQINNPAWKQRDLKVAESKLAAAESRARELREALQATITAIRESIASGKSLNSMDFDHIGARALRALASPLPADTDKYTGLPGVVATACREYDQGGPYGNGSVCQDCPQFGDYSRKRCEWCPRKN